MSAPAARPITAFGIFAGTIASVVSGQLSSGAVQNWYWLAVAAIAAAVVAILGTGFSLDGSRDAQSGRPITRGLIAAAMLFSLFQLIMMSLTFGMMAGITSTGSALPPPVAVGLMQGIIVSTVLASLIVAVLIGALVLSGSSRLIVSLCVFAVAMLTLALLGQLSTIWTGDLHILQRMPSENVLSIAGSALLILLLYTLCLTTGAWLTRLLALRRS